MIICSLLTLVSCGESKPEDISENDSTVVESNGGLERDSLEGVSADTGDVVEDAEGKYSLRLTPKVGETYGYRFESRGSNSVAGVTQSKKDVADVTLSVVSVNDDGSLVLGVTYNRIRASISLSGPLIDSTGKQVVDSTGKPQVGRESVEFDTKGGKDIPGAERTRAFIGRQVLVTLNPDGNVQDVANVDPILNAWLKGVKVMKDTVNPKALDYFRLGLRTEIGVLVSQLFFTLTPDSAVGVGSSWVQADSLPVGGLPASASVTVALQNIREVDDEQRAEIKTTLKTSIQTPKESVDNELYSMKINNVKVSGEGSWTVSLVSGFPINRKSTIRATTAGTATMKAGEMKGQPQKVAAKESTVTSVKRTSYRPAPSAGE